MHQSRRKGNIIGEELKISKYKIAQLKNSEIDSGEITYNDPYHCLEHDTDGDGLLDDFNRNGIPDYLK